MQKMAEKRLPSPPTPPTFIFWLLFISRTAKTKNPVPRSFFARKRLLRRLVSKQILSGSLAQVQCRCYFWTNFHTERPNEKGQLKLSSHNKRFLSLVPSVGHKIFAPWPPLLDMPCSGLCRKDLPESHT